MSHPHFGNCVYCRAKFFQRDLCQMAQLQKKKGKFLAILHLLHILERNSDSKKGPSWCPGQSRVPLFQCPPVTAGKQIWKTHRAVEVTPCLFKRPSCFRCWGHTPFAAPQLCEYHIKRREEEGEKQAPNHNRAPLKGFASAGTLETHFWQIYAQVKCELDLEIQDFGWVFFFFFWQVAWNILQKSPSAFDSSLRDNPRGREHRWALLPVASLTDPLQQPRQERFCYVLFHLQEWLEVTTYLSRWIIRTK